MARFPVRDAAPELGTIVRNFDTHEKLAIAGFSLGSLPLGYLGGKPRTVLVPTIGACFFLGTVGGLMYSWQRCAFRLRGLIPWKADDPWVTEIDKAKPSN
jgi:hypothetical protein